MQPEEAAQLIYRSLRRITRFSGADILENLPNNVSKIRPDSFLGRYGYRGQLIDFFGSYMLVSEHGEEGVKIPYRYIQSILPADWSLTSLPDQACNVLVNVHGQGKIKLMLWSDGRFTDAISVQKLLTRLAE